MAIEVLKQHIGDNVDRADFLALYNDYIDTLGAAGLPVIFEIEHLAALVGFEVADIAKMSVAPTFFYRHFSIPKATGGERLIAAPLPSLLSVQRWILDNILNKIPLDDAAHGFIAGRSILSNAKMHLNSAELLKCDIENFFPSIRIARVVAVFESFGYSPTVSVLLAKLCTFEGCLPQGAATSPQVSNIIVRRMDMRLRLLSHSLGLRYTRYADDMTFSGSEISLSFSKLVKKIVNEEGFNLNPKKTRLIRGKRRKVVAGISVFGEAPMLPKRAKREIRREVHLILVNGVIKQSWRDGVFDLKYIDRIMGKLSFWRSVEPNNTFVAKKWTQLRALQLQTLAIAD